MDILSRSKRLLLLTQAEKELDAVVRALTEPSRPMEERQALPPLALDQLRDSAQAD